jgi:predicted house-cleaning NTP pyrophosphatase (Maf/HAM1 superfamily)
MLVDRVDGCFFNVMGLPVARLVHRLREELELTDN